MGFSMGAAWSMMIAAEAGEKISAAVLFYGATDEDFGKVRAKILGHFAEVDEWEPMDGVRGMEEKMKAAGLDSARRMTIDALDPANVDKDREKWELIVRKTRAGQMPPLGVKRPDPEKFDAMIAAFEQTLDATAKPFTPPPGPVFQGPAANSPVTSGAGDNNGFQGNPTRAYINDGQFAVDTDKFWVQMQYRY